MVIIQSVPSSRDRFLFIACRTSSSFAFSHRPPLHSFPTRRSSDLPPSTVTWEPVDWRGGARLSCLLRAAPAQQPDELHSIGQLPSMRVEVVPLGLSLCCFQPPPAAASLIHFHRLFYAALSWGT